jgi:hypothetical protein
VPKKDQWGSKDIQQYYSFQSILSRQDLICSSVFIIQRSIIIQLEEFARQASWVFAIISDAKVFSECVKYPQFASVSVEGNWKLCDGTKGTCLMQFLNWKHAPPNSSGVLWIPLPGFIVTFK